MHLLLPTLYKLKQAVFITLIAASLLSCGSGLVTAGISGTGIVFGSITGFGSIFVNGVEYEIDDADFDVDGNVSASQSNLKIGMVVKLEATDNGDGTGIASSVVYDEIVEGPVASVNPTLDPEINTIQVFGSTIIINSLTTVFEGGASFDGVQVNDVVEVSGFVDQSGQVFATLIERKGTLQSGSEVEIHGQIEVSSLVLNTSFSINGVTIYYSLSTPLEDLENGLSEGLFVEVKGEYQLDGSVIALEIEGEDDDQESIEQSEGHVSLQGLITSFTDETHFSVNGISVVVDSAQVPDSILSQLVLGLQVEIEGVLENSVIQADEVEIRAGERKYQAMVTNVDTVNQTIAIGYPGITGEIELMVDSNSQLEDELSNNLLALSDLMVDDEVKVEVKIVEDEKIITSLKRDIIEKYEISGVVEAFVPDSSITIDSLLLPIEAGADLEPLDLFNQLVIGVSVVELEDEDKDPIAMFESVELE